MKNKTLAAVLAAVLILTSSGCGGETETSTQPSETAAQTTTAARSETEPDGILRAAAPERATQLSLGGDGLLSIKRKTRSASASMGDENTWTFFVYMCGTDLESEGAAATEDLNEMLAASTSQNVKFVVQTGGTSEWQNETVSAESLQRYVISGGALKLEEEKPLESMGSTDTLSDFLGWGIENYPSERMSVIFWNHGGGSITGVCFDELYENDSLSLGEIENALASVYDSMTDKFESIIFDACLMGTIEAANILVPYADYMIGSQELVSGCGLNYTVMGKTADENPDCSFADFAAAIFDGHYSDCAAYGEEGDVAFSCVDLSKIDALLKAFDLCARDIYETTGDASALASVSRSVLSAKNFGGNSRNEGYTNMIDLGDMLNSITIEIAERAAVLSALDEAVVAYKRGENQSKAMGLSIYYPLSVQGSEELNIFKNICVDPYYLSFVDRAAYGAANGSADGYDDSYWLGDGQSYYWSDYDEESDTEWSSESYYWDNSEYSDDYYNTDEENSALSVAEYAQYDSDGTFWMQLTENGLTYLNTAHCSVMLDINDDGSIYADLGTDYAVNVDWDTGIISDNFGGYWFCLPDGQPLSVFIICDEPDYSVYSSPVTVNGEETNLRIREDSEGNITIEGLFDGISDSGCASRLTGKLKSGDEICPLYPTYDTEKGGEEYYFGNTYVYDGDNSVLWDALFDGTYLYAFELTDIYGSYLLSDYAIYTIEDGEVYFDVGE